MPIHFNIKKDLRYQQGVAEGIAKGERKGKREGKLEGRLEGGLTAAFRIAQTLLNKGYDIT